MPLASYSSEDVDVIIVNLDTVTASDMGTHHMLIILTLTFIQGQTDLNHENNKCLIISETVQAIPIKCYVRMVRHNVNDYKHDRCQKRLHVRLKLDCFLTRNISDNIIFKRLNSNMAWR